MFLFYLFLLHPSPFRLADIFLDQEERLFFNLKEEQIKEETIALLKKISQNDVGSVYKLGETEIEKCSFILFVMNSSLRLPYCEKTVSFDIDS